VFAYNQGCVTLLLGSSAQLQARRVLHGAADCPGAVLAAQGAHARCMRSSPTAQLAVTLACLVAIYKKALPGTAAAE